MLISGSGSAKKRLDTAGEDKCNNRMKTKQKKTIKLA